MAKIFAAPQLEAKADVVGSWAVTINYYCSNRTETEVTEWYTGDIVGLHRKAVDSIQSTAVVPPNDGAANANSSLQTQCDGKSTQKGY